jgi:hypothetical protein
MTSATSVRALLDKARGLGSRSGFAEDRLALFVDAVDQDWQEQTRG